MFIIANKDINDAYNIEHIVNIYIGSDGRSVKVAAGATTRGGILGKYNSYDETRKALEILLERISRRDTGVVYMPSDSEVSSKMNVKEVYRHVSGKKTKGYGGS